jgi:hypothetical protein
LVADLASPAAIAAILVAASANARAAYRLTSFDSYRQQHRVEQPFLLAALRVLPLRINSQH